MYVLMLLANKLLCILVYGKRTTLTCSNTKMGNQWEEVSWLVTWCFEPSQPQKITSGLKTNFSQSPRYLFHKSLNHMSVFSLSLSLSNRSSDSIHKFGMQNQKNDDTLKTFLAYLYTMMTQHGNLHPTRWRILFYGPTQEPVLATANTGKTRNTETWQHKQWQYGDVATWPHARL